MKSASNLPNQTRASLVFLVRMVTRTRKEAADYAPHMDAIRKNLRNGREKPDLPISQRPPVSRDNSPVRWVLFRVLAKNSEIGATLDKTKFGGLYLR